MLPRSRPGAGILTQWPRLDRRVPLIVEALAALARNAPFDFKEGRETL
jgi:hypothetical protein